MPSSAVRRTASQSIATLPAPLRNCAVQAAASARWAALRTQMRWGTLQWNARGSNQILLAAAHCSSPLACVIGRCALASAQVHLRVSQCTTEPNRAQGRAAQKSPTAERVAPQCGAGQRTTLQHVATYCTAMHRMYSTASRLGKKRGGADGNDGQLPLAGRGPAMPGGAVHRNASGASSASGAMAGSGHSSHRSNARGGKDK